MKSIILPKALLAKTELGEAELNEAYDDFYQVYPGGEISEQEFLQISKVKVFEDVSSLSHKLIKDKLSLCWFPILGWGNGSVPVPSV